MSSEHPQAGPGVLVAAGQSWAAGGCWHSQPSRPDAVVVPRPHLLGQMLTLTPSTCTPGAGVGARSSGCALTQPYSSRNCFPRKHFPSQTGRVSRGGRETLEGGTCGGERGWVLVSSQLKIAAFLWGRNTAPAPACAPLGPQACATQAPASCPMPQFAAGSWDRQWVLQLPRDTRRQTLR